MQVYSHTWIFAIILIPTEAGQSQDTRLIFGCRQMTHVIEKFGNLSLDNNQFSEFCLLSQKKYPRLESKDQQLESLCKAMSEDEFGVKQNVRSRRDQQMHFQLFFEFCFFRLKRTDAISKKAEFRAEFCGYFYHWRSLTI